MRTTIETFIICGFLIAVGLVTARAGDTTSFNAWLAAQTNVHSWSAEVIQTRSLKTLAQPLVATGRVWFAAPNQFRWELGNPALTIAVRQTNEMLVIYPRLKRVERYPLTGTQNNQWRDMLALLEAGFPRSQADLEARFKITTLTTTTDSQQIALHPRSPSARRLMPQILLTFSTNDLTLHATELQFADGSTLRNEFLRPALNPKLPDDTFAPKFGADFKVVEPMKRP